MSLLKFFQVKDFIKVLSDKKLFLKLFYVYMGLFLLVVIMVFLSNPGQTIIRTTYENANMPWPPELNNFNLIVLRDIVLMILVFYAVTFIVWYFISFIVSKILKLFKRKISIAKIWNLIAYAMIIATISELVAMILFMLYDIFYLTSVSSLIVFSLIVATLLFILLAKVIQFALPIYGIIISLEKTK